MDKEKLHLRIKYNSRLQSIVLNDIRISGCKWNDVDYANFLFAIINKNELLEAIGMKNAIQPKFNEGDKVFVTDGYTIKRDAFVDEVYWTSSQNRFTYRIGISYDINDTQYETLEEWDLFETEKEAQEVLKIMKESNNEGFTEQ